MGSKQRGISSAAVVVIITIVLVVVIVFLKQRGGMPGYSTESQQNPQSTSDVQNSNDLDSATADLDNTNPDEMDNDLNQLGSDASAF